MRFKYEREFYILLILVVAVVALYSTFAPVKCNELWCFSAYMSKCKPAIFVNDLEPEATWEYRVIGTSKKKCEVEVKLLIAKDTGVDLRGHEGEVMICAHPIGVSGYPEKDLAACKGELKESLQSIVIEKLYKYLVTNLGEIKGGII